VQRALAPLDNNMKTFNISLNEDQINTVAAGLNELPAKFANPVLQEITKQLQAQTAEKVVAEEVN
jgi:hypothetical protein